MGTSPADGPAEGDAAARSASGATVATGSGEAAGAPAERAAAASGASGATEAGPTATASGESADAPAEPEAAGAGKAEAGAGKAEAGASRADADAGKADAPAEQEAADGADVPGAPATGAETRRSRRFSLTRDTARPEGGGRAAGGDAPAPARQWPLLAVLCTAGAGLLIVAANPFAEAFRVGTILIGLALVAGAVLRIAVRSVGMLAVRSRFTDLVTYGLLGTLIVLLALVAQPKPWLDIPFLEDAVHFTVR